MASDNLDSADLKAVAYGGLIHEDVMDRIWDISRVPLSFTDLVGSGGSVSNSYKEWTIDELQDQDLDNAKIDGQSLIDEDDTSVGKRVGNHCQESTKTVKVSTRANSSNTIGRARELTYQIMMRQQELRRDVEGIAQKGTQGSRADNGSTIAGLSADFPSWLTSNVNAPGDATIGGFNFSTGLVEGYQAGTRRAGSYDDLNQLIEQCWTAGGNPSTIMGVPSGIRKFTEGVIDSTAKVAPLRANVGGEAAADMAGQGSVNIYVTQHGPVLNVVSNRLQPTHDDFASNPAYHMQIIDPGYCGLGYLTGYRTEVLAKTGLAENRQIIVDWTLIMNNEEAHALYADLDPTAAWTA